MIMTEIPKLESDQEEINTRVVLYCSYAVDEEYNHARVTSANINIFFILLYYASKINITLLFDTGFRCKRSLLLIFLLPSKIGKKILLVQQIKWLTTISA